jgi:hypothetical protein
VGGIYLWTPETPWQVFRRDAVKKPGISGAQDDEICSIILAVRWNDSSTLQPISTIYLSFLKY